MDGIVTRGHGKQFVVFADGNYYNCHLRGKVKFKTSGTTPVAVGDDVKITITGTGDDEAVIESVCERKSVLSRPAVSRETTEHVLAANIDSLVIVTSVMSPPLKPGLIDRFLITAQVGGLHPVILINKIELQYDDLIRSDIEVYRSLGYDLFMISAKEEIGLEDLRSYLRNHRSIFAGHSGVGKSTILNKLLPDVNIKTGHTQKVTGKGRHTTSHIELFHLPGGGFVVDSPGIKVLGLWQIERGDLAHYYPEMQAYINQCRFTGCSHIPEPECAVKNAVAKGIISELRYRNYMQIYDSL